MNQLGLFGEPDRPEPVEEAPAKRPEPVVPDLRARLMEALRRDVDTLASPTERAKLSADVPALLEERITDYRRRLSAIEEA